MTHTYDDVTRRHGSPWKQKSPPGASTVLLCGTTIASAGIRERERERARERERKRERERERPKP